MLEYSSTPAQRDQNIKTWKKERWGLLSQTDPEKVGMPRSLSTTMPLRMSMTRTILKMMLQR